MTRIIIVLFIVFGLSSCYTENKQTVEVPDSLLSEEQIIEILTDLQLAEGIINNRRLGKPTTDRDFKDSIYMVVFNHYEITAEKLTENLNYYNNDVEKMEKMYEKVLVNLSKYETEIRVEEKKQDSVSKAQGSFVDEEE